jgi:hypothetical protein
VVIGIDLGAVGIREVLAGLRFPAPRWLVIAQAHYWGADAYCIQELNRLPIKTYQTLAEVAAALREQRAALSRVG